MDSLLSPHVPLSYLQALPTIDMNNINDNNSNLVNNNGNINVSNNGNNNINNVNNNNSNVYTPIVQPAATKVSQSSSLPPPPKKRASFTACAACQSKHCACDEQRYVINHHKH